MTQKAIGDYVIASDSGNEAERLRLLGEWRDPITLSRMEALGLGEGWRCLEVGVGCGSTARAIAARVVPTGLVTAADINPAFLAALDGESEVASLGLVDVGMHIDTAAVQGGTDLARWYAMTIEAIRDGLVSEGAVTDDELSEVIAALGGPDLLEPGFTFVGVWGRKPR